MLESRSVPQLDPWDRESPMTRELLVDGAPNGKARFHKLDTWHALHLGVGKSWVAGAMFLLQEKISAASTIDARMDELSKAYRSFCREMRIVPFISSFDRHTFGGGGSVEADGCWSKAALTSNLMLFVEHLCAMNSELVLADEQLRYIVPRL